VTDRLNASSFVDLYIGESFSQMSGLDGAMGIQAAPKDLCHDIAMVRAKCLHVYKADRNPEFFLQLGSASYRVTTMESLRETVFTVRQCKEPRPARTLGLGDGVLSALLDRSLRGLVLVCGEMKMGKTNTAASVFVERVKLFGGLGLAVEDPPEMVLEGKHGEGHVMQLWANPQRGGYPEQMRRGMRSGAEVIMLGEIRDGVTASEACRAGINGHLVISTGHGGSPLEGIERLHALALQQEPSAANLLADGLAVVLWQTLEPVVVNDRHVKRMRTKMLVVKGSDSVQAKIREGRFSALVQDMQQQASAAAWATGATKK